MNMIPLCLSLYRSRGGAPYRGGNVASFSDVFFFSFLLLFWWSMSQHTRTHTKERGRQYGSLLYLPHFVSSFTVNPSFKFHLLLPPSSFWIIYALLARTASFLYKIRSRFWGKKCICLSRMHLWGISSRLCMKSELTFMLKELLRKSITLTDDSPRQSIGRIWKV